MQIASNPEIQVVSIENISELKRKEVERFENSKEDLQNKPEEIRNKIIEGRVEKSLKREVLLEQEYIRDPNISVNDYIKQVISLLGENIKVARFTRFVLGETQQIEE
jgi:elongation factor Ts